MLWGGFCLRRRRVRRGRSFRGFNAIFDGGVACDMGCRSVGYRCQYVL